MKETFIKVLKVIAWVIMVPVILFIYTITMLATYRLEGMTQWSWALSLGVVAIFTLGVALRNKLGGLTVSVFIATCFNLLISATIYSCTF